MTDVFSMLRNAEAKIKQLTEERDSAVAWREIALVAIKKGVPAKKVPDVVYRATLPGTWKMSETGGFKRQSHDYTDTKKVSLEEAVEELRVEDHLWSDDVQKPAEPVTKPKSTPPSTPPTSVADTYSSANPWAKETFNLTQQSRIYTADPDRAFTLATKAGKPVFAGGKVGIRPE